MQGTIMMSLESAIHMISDKKRPMVGEHTRMIGQHETSGGGIEGELTSLDEMDMSNMQD